MKKILVVMAISAAFVALPAVAQTYAGFGLGIADTDTQRTSSKLFAGVQVIENFGVEMAYNDLGSYRGSGSSALSLALTATLPLGDTFDLLGKWGASQNHSNFTSADKTESMWGFGVGFNVSPAVAIRLEYENFGRLPTDADGTSTLATSRGINMKYSF